MKTEFEIATRDVVEGRDFFGHGIEIRSILLKKEDGRWYRVINGVSPLSATDTKDALSNRLGLSGFNGSFTESFNEEQ